MYELYMAYGLCREVTFSCMPFRLVRLKIDFRQQKSDFLIGFDFEDGNGNMVGIEVLKMLEMHILLNKFN